MVIRRRGLRSFFLSLGLYAVAAATVGYFLFHAHHGSRGLETKEAILAATQTVRLELAELASERQNWEHRVALVRSDAMDRDILDELARGVLGRVHKNDVVIMGR
jgi:cell division protein FtsB